MLLALNPTLKPGPRIANPCGRALREDPPRNAQIPSSDLDPRARLPGFAPGSEADSGCREPICRHPPKQQHQTQRNDWSSKSDKRDS